MDEQNVDHETLLEQLHDSAKSRIRNSTRIEFPEASAVETRHLNQPGLVARGHQMEQVRGKKGKRWLGPGSPTRKLSKAFANQLRKLLSRDSSRLALFKATEPASGRWSTASKRVSRPRGQKKSRTVVD